MKHEHYNPKPEKTAQTTLGDLVEQGIKNRAEKKHPGDAKKQIDYIIELARKAKHARPSARKVADIVGDAAYRILRDNFGREEADKLLNKVGVNLDD